MGPGPLNCFHTPFHLCHFEIHNSIARAVLLGDATITPLGAPAVDVVATAKTDLKAGDVLDRIGGYLSYGQCENADVVYADGLLPLGVADGGRLRRDVPRDQVLTYADVDLPPDRLCDRLRAEQGAALAAGRSTLPVGVGGSPPQPPQSWGNVRDAGPGQAPQE